MRDRVWGQDEVFWDGGIYLNIDWSRDYTGIYIYINIDWTVQLKWVHFIICKLYQYNLFLKDKYVVSVNFMPFSFYQNFLKGTINFKEGLKIVLK